MWKLRNVLEFLLRFGFLRLVLGQWSTPGWESHTELDICLLSYMTFYSLWYHVCFLRLLFHIQRKIDFVCRYLWYVLCSRKLNVYSLNCLDNGNRKVNHRFMICKNVILLVATLHNIKFILSRTVPEIGIRRTFSHS